MHFEISEQKLRRWQKDGPLTSNVKPKAAATLMLGDRAERVVELQRRLNKLGESLDLDGIFGPATHAAVVAFQGAHGLSADGVVGTRTWNTLVSLTP
jgi:peptidoglycan hydrolase-like protein with peptidoglycan-binding domain